jgi:hypothetical protein
LYLVPHLASPAVAACLPLYHALAIAPAGRIEYQIPIARQTDVFPIALRPAYSDGHRVVAFILLDQCYGRSAITSLRNSRILSSALTATQSIACHTLYDIQPFMTE